MTGILFSNAHRILALTGWDRRMQANRRDEEACLPSADHVTEPACCSQRGDRNSRMHPQAHLCPTIHHRVYNFSLGPVSNEGRSYSIFISDSWASQVKKGPCLKQLHFSLHCRFIPRAETHHSREKRSNTNSA